MTKDEALKLALEALESLCNDSELMVTHRQHKGMKNAITAIKEALAQPEQEEIERAMLEVWQDVGDPRFPHIAQPEQEPHSWYSKQENEWMTHKTRMEHEQLNSYTHKVGKFDLALYTTPPQRKPLTIVELQKHWQVAKVLDMTDAEISFPDYVLITKDVEALHGIKE